MIIVDTNVLSEEMKPVPAASVLSWFRRQSAVNLFTTAVCQAEILVGLAILPDGRKLDLDATARSVLGFSSGESCPSIAQLPLHMPRSLQHGSELDAPSTISMLK